MSWKHFECVFYSPTTDTCDFMLITGFSRGCSSEHCTRCASSLDGYRPIRKGYRPRKIQLDLIHRLEKKYNPTISPPELAEHAGVPTNFTFFWMRKAHPESKALNRRYYGQET